MSVNLRHTLGFVFGPHIRWASDLPGKARASKMMAEIKNSDPSHPKALYTVYYPPHVSPKMMGSMSLKLLASRQSPFQTSHINA